MSHTDVLLEAPLRLKDLPTVRTQVGLSTGGKLVARLGCTGRCARGASLGKSAHLEAAQILVAECLCLGGLQQNQLVVFRQLGTCYSSTTENLKDEQGYIFSPIPPRDVIGGEGGGEKKRKLKKKIRGEGTRKDKS
jgi:hypothetical protein